MTAVTEKTAPTTPPASAEQAADLAALEQAAGGTPDAATPAEVDTPAPQRDDAEDVFNVLQMVRDMAAPGVAAMDLIDLDVIESIWTDDVLRKVAQPLAEIMRRHDVGLDVAMERYGPYVMLVVGLWGPATATWKAMKLHARTVVVDAADKSKPAEGAPA